ncbi:hypothetical protein Cgig2_018742 [Carnegiea gigantea]|uniref:Uncharacterized protein n=1 Tax=Carnegiea gigantea TaxID=171969 RepID=A0A9Q1JV58_9CARY|nr:hypothetical protein Cgig2_018742 [Carnegiea gigantea]
MEKHPFEIRGLNSMPLSIDNIQITLGMAKGKKEGHHYSQKVVLRTYIRMEREKFETFLLQAASHETVEHIREDLRHQLLKFSIYDMISSPCEKAIPAEEIELEAITPINCDILNDDGMSDKDAPFDQCGLQGIPSLNFESEDTLIRKERRKGM